MVPDTYIKLEGQQAAQMIRLLEALEDNEDVQNVHANFDIDQKVLEEVGGISFSSKFSGCLRKPPTRRLFLCDCGPCLSSSFAPDHGAAH